MMRHLVVTLVLALAACMGGEPAPEPGPDAGVSAMEAPRGMSPAVPAEDPAVPGPNWTLTIDRACEELCSRLEVGNAGTCHYECVQTVHPTCEVLSNN